MVKIKSSKTPSLQMSIKILLLTMIVTSSLGTEVVDFGDALSGDQRFLYPSDANPDEPFSSELPKEIDFKLHFDFFNDHNKTCTNPIRGTGQNRSKAFFLCDGNDIQISDPQKKGSGKLSSFYANGLKKSSIDVFGFSNTNTTIFVKKETGKTFQFYSIKTKLGEKTGNSNLWNTQRSSLRLISSPTKASLNEVYLYIEPTLTQQKNKNLISNTEIIQFNAETKNSELLNLRNIKNLSSINTIQNLQVSETHISFGCRDDKGKMFSCICPYDKDQKNQFEKCKVESGSDLEKALRVFQFQSMTEGFRVTEQSEGQIEIVYSLQDNDDDLKLTAKTVKDSEIHSVFATENQVLISWRSSQKKIVSIWQIRAEAGKIIQREVNNLDCEEIIFLYPDYILEVRGNYQAIHKSFSYAFKTKELGDKGYSKKLKFLRGNKIVEKEIKIKLVDVLDIETTQESTETVIEAPQDSVLDYFIPEENIRGNALEMKMEKDKNVLLTRENDLNVTQENKDDRLEFLDDLYAQSLRNKVFTMHRCQLDISTQIAAQCKKLSEINIGSEHIMAQVNTLTQIFTIFKIEASGELRMIIFDKIKAKFESYKDIDVGKSQISSMIASFGIYEGKPVLYLGYERLIRILFFKSASYETYDDRTFSLSYLPTPNGKPCQPLSFSVFPMHDSGSIARLKGYAVYRCESRDVIVRINSHQDIKEVDSYPKGERLACSTQGGSLFANVKANTTPTLTLKRENNEKIQYHIDKFSIKSISSIFCELPTLPQSVILAKDNADKSVIFVTSVTDTDPLKLIPVRMEMSKEVVRVKVAKAKERLIISVHYKDGTVDHKLVSLDKIRVIFTVRSESKNKFLAERDGTSRRFELGFKIKPRKQDEFKMKSKSKINFQKKGKYDLSMALDITGPVSRFNMKIPESLKEKVSFKDRTSLEEGKSLSLPSAQREHAIYKSKFLLMRSNDFETQIDQILPDRRVSIAHISMPCKRIDFSIRPEEHDALILVSCPFYDDVALYVNTDSNGELILKQKLFFKHSRDGRVVYYDKERAAIAAAVRANGGSLQVRLSKVKWDMEKKDGKLQVLDEELIEKGKLDILIISWVI